jgi:hypothetical protein
MTIDDLMAVLYEKYEQHDCDGEIPVMISTYSCGQTSERPLLLQELEIVTNETGEPRLVIRAEDN